MFMNYYSIAVGSTPDRLPRVRGLSPALGPGDSSDQKTINIMTYCMFVQNFLLWSPGQTGDAESQL